jgi:hypothetical protein
VQGVKYANHTRDALISQITAMRARFRTYTSYANATFDQTLTPEESADAIVVTAEDFESKYLENLGTGKFKWHSLPILVQAAPVFGICVEDWDEDGNLDALISGSSYTLEVITGRADANPGTFLKGNGSGEFTMLPLSATGFHTNGDSKGIVRMVTGDQHNVVLVANNNGPMQTFNHKKSAHLLHPTPDDVSAIVTLNDNKKRKYEFYNGSGYLSNGSKTIVIPANALTIEIMNTKSEKRFVDPKTLQ